MIHVLNLAKLCVNLLLLAIFHTTYQDKIHIQPITDYILIHMYKRVGWNWEEE